MKPERLLSWLAEKNAGFVVAENRSRALNVFNIVLSVCRVFFCGNITGALTLLQV